MKKNKPNTSKIKPVLYVTSDGLSFMSLDDATAYAKELTSSEITTISQEEADVMLSALTETPDSLEEMLDALTGVQ